jgi:hypothetical protein
MNTLYVLGGPPRTAKTTIMAGLVADKHVQFVAADAVEHGLRNVLTGQPHQMLKNIEFTGSAEHKASFTGGGIRKPFSNKGKESELTFQAILGMLDYYRRNNESVAFEGSLFTPERVAGLKQAGFTIRAAFVGYTNPAHADSIIAHAKENPHDWINEWLQKEQGDETGVREWVAKQVAECQDLKVQAQQQGYPFFDISTQPFEDYVGQVQAYLGNA